MWTAIAGLIGLISTIVAWNLNPKRQLYQQLDDLYKQLDRLYRERDDALARHDTDTLTRATDDIIRLRNKKNSLLQRL